MKPKSITVHHIPAGGDVVDAIDVFIAWYGEQAFQITIRCYDHAWTAYRGSCGRDCIEDYFIELWFEHDLKDHLVDLFLRAHKQTKRERDWLHRVIGNMCEYFKGLEVV